MRPRPAWTYPESPNAPRLAAADDAAHGSADHSPITALYRNGLQKLKQYCAASEAAAKPP